MRYVSIVLTALSPVTLLSSRSTFLDLRADALRSVAFGAVAHNAARPDTLIDSVRFVVLETVVGFRREFLGDTIKVEPCSLQHVARLDSAKMESAFKSLQFAIAPWESCKPGPRHTRLASYVTIDSVTRSGGMIAVWTVLTDRMYSRRETYELLIPARGYPNVARIVQSDFSIADLAPPPPLRSHYDHTKFRLPR